LYDCDSNEKIALNMATPNDSKASSKRNFSAMFMLLKL